MNGGFNFSISPEGLDEKGSSTLKECEKMRTALGDIEIAMRNLESWQSENKGRFETKIKNALPHMYEMIEVIESYGGVAKQTSRRIVDVERKIATAIENN